MNYKKKAEQHEYELMQKKIELISLLEKNQRKNKKKNDDKKNE